MTKQNNVIISQFNDDRIKAVAIPPPNMAGTTNSDIPASKPMPEIPWPL